MHIHHQEVWMKERTKTENYVVFAKRHSFVIQFSKFYAKMLDFSKIG